MHIKPRTVSRSEFLALKAEMVWLREENIRLRRIVVQRFFGDFLELSEEWPPEDWTDFEDFDLFHKN